MNTGNILRSFSRKAHCEGEPLPERACYEEKLASCVDLYSIVLIIYFDYN